jgi:hypothetical protein
MVATASRDCIVNGDSDADTAKSRVEIGEREGGACTDLDVNDLVVLDNNIDLEWDKGASCRSTCSIGTIHAHDFVGVLQNSNIQNIKMFMILRFLILISISKGHDAFESGIFL